MPEFLSKFSNQITEYWNKFTRTQKIQIIAIFLASITALVVLTLILSKPEYKLYREDVKLSDMNTIESTLIEQGIKYQISEDATSISIESGKYKEAILALAEVGILPNDGFTYDKYFANLSLTMSTTDKKIMAKLAAETKLAENIAAIAAVEEANVSLVIPEAKSLFEDDKEATASIWLNLRDDLSEDQILGIASIVESAIENLSIDHIKIFDRGNTKLLYNGGTGGSAIGGVNSQLEVERNQESYYANEIEMLLLNGGEYDDAVVSVNLKVDFDKESSQSVEHNYPDGETSSLPIKVYSMTQSGTNTEAGGVPGTDSNSDTTEYPIDTGSGSESSSEVSDTTYAVNEKTTNLEKSLGSVVPDDSSISITLIKLTPYSEALLEANGDLAETTWEQYQADNNASTPIEVNEELKRSVANYANLNEDNVVILGYNKPQFIDKPIEGNQIADYIPVIIIVLMIALLGYAVYKGTEPVEITEVEPELSVEDMLSSTKVSEELEAIELDGKSDARVQIEKFVEENPEAVAQLLRNWLNEDWE